MRFIKEAKSNLLYNLALIAISIALTALGYAVFHFFGGVVPVLLFAGGIALIGCSTISFIECLVLSRQAFKSQNEYKKVHAVEEITGPPGAGKTTLTNVFFYLSVLNMQKKLEKDYYVNECHALKAHWIKNSVFRENLAETRYAKEYYDKSEFYPCAFSNQSMKIKGVSVHKFTHDHSVGKKVVPPYSVEDVEEASDIYYTTTHADRVPEWGTDARFKRHQVKETFLVEQEVTNINKDVRRVVGVTMELEERIMLGQPQLAMWIYGEMLKFGMKHNIINGAFTDIFDFLGKIIGKVGVVKWKYYTMSGTESKIQRPPQKGTFTAFMDLPIEFDSRMFRNVPQTRNLKDKRMPEGYKSLVLEKDSAEAELMRTAKMKKKED
ncbi:MAG: DUF4229 domain-containing protein [Bacillota bacterium]